MRDQTKRRTCEFCYRDKPESDFENHPNDVRLIEDVDDLEIEFAHYCRSCLSSRALGGVP